MAARSRRHGDVPGVAQQQRRGAPARCRSGRRSACRAAERRASKPARRLGARRAPGSSRGSSAFSARLHGRRPASADSAVERDDLAERVDAGVGAAGARHAHARPRSSRRAARRAGALHGRERRLDLPAVEAGAVVGQHQPEGRGAALSGGVAGEARAVGTSVSHTTATSEEQRDADERAPTADLREQRVGIVRSLQPRAALVILGLVVPGVVAADGLDAAGRRGAPPT